MDMDRERKLIKAAGFLLADTIKRDLRAMLEVSRFVGSDMACELQDKRMAIRSFGELGDIMDHNVLGKSEDMHRIMTYGIPESGDEAAVQLACDVLNAAHDEVDAWIKAGGLR